MGMWHLTYEENYSICRMVENMAVQTSAEICPACLDAYADARLQWLSLDLSKLMMKHDYKCERCRQDFIGKPISIHHRRPRMMGGSKNAELHKPANLLALCGTGTSGCHGWVESNRDKARELGYLIAKVESAEQIPFKDLNGDWWQIDNYGQKTQLDIKRNYPNV